MGLQVEHYIKKKHDLSAQQMQNIQWHDIDYVLRGTSIAKQTQFIKIFHQKWPTMYRNKRWKQSTTDQCPMCLNECKDSIHVYQCSDTRAKTNRSFHILELRKKLQGISTDPFIVNHIGRIIYQFSSNFPVNHIHTTETSTEDITFKAKRFNNQIDMGVQLFYPDTS